MPKILDRSRWVLLPIGQDQGGWLDRRGSQIHGRFTTYWRLPDGTEKARDERIVLGPRSIGVKAAEHQLSERIRKFFDTHLKTLAPAITPNDESNFTYLLARVEADRKGDWKKNGSHQRHVFQDPSREAWPHSCQGLRQSGDEGVHQGLDC
jgi:hypothetical protein